jgi:phosphohistidine phosphatase
MEVPAMILYLVQHGEAVDKEIDPDRPLSDAGRREVATVADFLAVRPVPIDHIWHSGKPRAKETADILAARLAPHVQPQERPGLAPKDPVVPLRDLLGTYEDDIMLVGHLPHLAKLAGLLLAGDENQTPVRFAKGGVLCLIQDESDHWQIAWMVVPELLAYAATEPENSDG